jgi:hypothetical protein
MSNSDYWNIIFAPIDNVGRYNFQTALKVGTKSIVSLNYLGRSLHVMDVAVFHHSFNTLGHGHAEFEEWADAHYSDKEWFHDQESKINEFITTYYTQDNIEPKYRPFRWLVHRLHDFIFNEKFMNRVWDRYVPVEQYDQKYYDYCVEVYPAMVALAVIILEKFLPNPYAEPKYKQDNFHNNY